MMFIGKIFFLLNCIYLGRTAAGVRFPSKQMMLEGYYFHSARTLMSLVKNGIQAIPKGAFTDFPNITVSLCDLIISVISS